MAGMLMGALVAGRAAQRFPGGVLVLVSVRVFVLAAVISAIAPIGLLAVGALFVATLASLHERRVRGATWRCRSPMTCRGAQAAATTLSMIAMPLAPLVAGIGLDLVSVHVVLAVFAGTCALALLPVLVSRTVRRLGRSSSWISA